MKTKMSRGGDSLENCRKDEEGGDETGADAKDEKLAEADQAAMRGEE